MSQDCDHEKAVFIQKDEDGNEVKRCMVCEDVTHLTLDDHVDDSSDDESFTREVTRQ